MKDFNAEGAPAERVPCDVCERLDTPLRIEREHYDTECWRLGYLRLAAALQTEREPPNRTDRAWRDGAAAAAQWVQEAWDQHGVTGADVIAVGLRAFAAVGPGIAAEPPPETRECENCGKQKPIEEMETVFARGHGETYQCLACRGGP